MTTLVFPDGSKHEVDESKTYLQIISEEIGEGLAKAAVAVELNGETLDLTRTATTNGEFKVLTFKDQKGKEVFRHSAAHVLAIAVRRLFPSAKLTIGPSIEEGFYYDIDNDKSFTPEDLEKIEDEMKKILAENISFKRNEVSKDQAIQIISENQKDNHYKIELINDLGDEQLTIYDHGTPEMIEFRDLCRGPHVPHVGKIKAVKLTKVSGAFWRGDAKNKQLQRIYGVAFPSKDELKDYLKMLEEAQKRDHRKIGKELDLIMFHEYSPGAPFFLKNGTVLYNELVGVIRNEQNRQNYSEVMTPQLFNKKLWEISGHWEHYRENMFEVQADNQEHAIKAMNCPAHCLIFKRDAKSYRDLPLRMAEFGVVHRNEASGALGGLFRVRKFTQDDAHIFCGVEQLGEEIYQVLSMVNSIWQGLFQFKLEFFLSTKPEGAMGSDDIWEKAENQLKDALEKMKVPYEIKEGDGAFYGPKVDVDLTDALGRKWQCATMQLDFNLPERFELEYEGSDGKKHRPVMIHRAIFGSIERAMGIIIEKYAGKFPLWLSPVQVKLLPIADRHTEYAQNILSEMKARGIRAEINTKSETINKKVRDAQLEQVNYILVIGDKEIENTSVNVRTRENEVLGEKNVTEFIEEMLSLVSQKK